MIPCPNCGLSNAANARFCANCGTPLGATAPPPPPYQTSAPASRLTGKNIALGCVILLAIVLLFGVSCTRACFGFRRSHYVHRRYAWAPGVSSPKNLSAFRCFSLSRRECAWACYSNGFSA